MTAPHTPTFTPVETPGFAHPVWWWSCSCGVSSEVGLEAKVKARLHHYSNHVFIGVAAPTHLPTYFQDEMGITVWTCDCGVSGRAGGHIDERRARQSHSAHVNRELLKWYTFKEKQATAQTREDKRSNEILENLI